MNKPFMSGLLIGFGAAIASGLTSYLYFKKKFQDKFAEEMDEIQHLNDISNDIKEFSSKSKNTKESEEKATPNNRGNINSSDGKRINYSEIANEYIKTDNTSKEKKDNESFGVIIPKEPYFIDEKDTETDESKGYDVEFLYLYSDDVVANDEGVIVENIDTIIGKDTLEQFDENQKDNKIYIRNDKIKCDYVIEKDSRPYFNK